MPHPLRILHISDLHERGSRESETWRRRRVLGEAWERNVDAILEDGPLDIVCFTGDAADWGLPEEFSCAAGFFEALLAKTNLPRERLFVIPGNHDIARTVEPEAWKQLRELFGSTPDTLDLARWLGGGRPPAGIDGSLPGRVLRRMAPYNEWLAHGLKRPELVPASGLLGYRTAIDAGLGYPIHLIGLNTAWLCGDDADAGRLWALDDQLMRLVSDENGKPLRGLRILMMHHPFDQLADGAHCRRLLAGRVDLVLRGHLHDESVETWAEPGTSVRQLAVGCLYEGWRADSWPNSCHVLSIDADPRGQPHLVNLRFRTWSHRGGHWHDDDSLYAESKNGRLSWTLPRVVAKEVCPHENPFDPWTPVVPPDFVGRVSVLARLQDALDEGRSVSVVGDWRIGKSSLLQTCMVTLAKAGRPARLLSGEGREGESPAVFVECATGVRAGESADNAADVLSNWARQTGKPGAPPALLVDEFDSLVVRFDHRFFERLRGMLDYLCVVVSSRRELDGLYKNLGRTSPFHNRLELCWLGLLESDAADTLAARSGGVLPHGAHAMVREWAGRHPFFIQLFGRKLIDSCRYGESLEDAKEQFLAEAGMRLREIWGTLREKDQQVLEASVHTPQPQARTLRRRGLLTEDGRPFGRLLVEWLQEESR